MVLRRIDNGLGLHHGLLPGLQYAYWPNRSTPTAVLKVSMMCCWLSTKDEGDARFVGIAFDSVDHDTLRLRLQASHGLEGNVISWLFI